MQIHTIEGKKVLQGLIWGLICVILFIVAYKIWTVSDFSISSYSSMSNISKKGKIPISIYQRWLGESVPHMNYPKREFKDHMLVVFFQWLTHINIKDKTTLLDEAIPIMFRVNQEINKENNFVEVYPRLNSKKEKHLEQIEEKFEEEIDFFKKEDKPPSSAISSIPKIVLSQENLNNLNFLKENFYIIEANMPVTIQDFPTKAFIEKNFQISITNQDEPKILIFHTHSQEAFVDSRPGVKEDTVVGLGQSLADILKNKYGVDVIHDTGTYDMVNGKLNRSTSYERMEEPIRKILQKYPSIEVVIDLHRDGVPDNVRLCTTINGKSTAKFMFVNGLSKKMQNGIFQPIDYLPNPYLEDNMAFSFQMQLKANELYPGLTRKIYIKPYRYSLHMKPKSLLVEVGAQTNTVEEAYNAMEPLAHILISVLKEEG